MPQRAVRGASSWGDANKADEGARKKTAGGSMKTSEHVNIARSSAIRFPTDF